MRKLIIKPLPHTLGYGSIPAQPRPVWNAESKESEKNDRENNVVSGRPIRRTQVVRGYYSDDDVKLLLDALLNKKSIKKIGELKDEEDGAFIANIFFSGGKKTIALAPIVEGEEDTKGRMTQLKKDLVAAYNNKIDQVLVPINKHLSHWYSLKLELSYNEDMVAVVGLYLHDSLYKRSSEDLQKISDNLEAIVLTSFGISKEQLIGKPSVLPLIQRGVGGAINCYCGGYTARLIANLIMNPYVDQYSNEEAWSCLDNRDDTLRQNDARIVEQHNSHNAGNFGAKPMYASEAILKAQEASLIRSFIANEKARQIIQELKTIYEDIPEEIKLCIRSLKIPKDPSSLSAIVRDLYTGLPFLKTLFQTNAAREVERDAEGLLKLDTTIEMDQVYHIMIEFQRTCFKLEGIEVPELEDVELGDQSDLIEVGPLKEADTYVSFVNKLNAHIQYISSTVTSYEIAPYWGNIKIYNSNFVGRTRELKIIQTKLKSIKPVTVKGISGVGKTSIALHYARTTQEYIPIWFRADSSTSLARSYREFGESLKLNLDRIEETMVMNLINSKIANSNHRVLFIFDDLNGDYADNYLKSLPYNAKLLITIRQAKQLGKIEEELWLGQFIQEEASEYLKNNGIKQLEIDLLIEKVGTVPQHLSLAVGYLRYNEAKTLEARENTLKAKTIFEITIGEIAKKHKTAWEVLQYVVWLDSNFIPEEILSELLGNDIQELWSAIRELENYSLVSVVEKTDSGMLGLELHRNLQNEVRVYINKYSNQGPAQSLERVLQALNRLLPKGGCLKITHK